MADVMNQIKNILRNNIVICGGLAASVFVNVVFWIYVIIKARMLTPPIIIRYSVYFGAELMGGVNNIYMLPAIGSFVIILNAALIILLRKKAQIASNMLIGTLFLSQLFLFIAGISLIMINT